MLFRKKLNFDQLTPSPGSGGGRRGGRRGKSKKKIRDVRASHTLLGKLTKGQFLVLSTRIIPAAGNGESCLGPVFRLFSNSH